MPSLKISPDMAIAILKEGGYLQRRDERATPRRCCRMTTRLYDKNGNDLGVANYARRRLCSMLKVIEVKGPKNEQRWILKQ